MFYTIILLIKSIFLIFTNLMAIKFFQFGAFYNGDNR